MLDSDRLSVIPAVEALARAIEYQDRKYGAFTHSVGSVRLAIACLEDEVAEARQAWRDERRKPETLVPLWPITREEALQVAAIALRLIRDSCVDPVDEAQRKLALHLPGRVYE